MAAGKVAGMDTVADKVEDTVADKVEDIMANKDHVCNGIDHNNNYIDYTIGYKHIDYLDNDKHYNKY
jgi:hypothetical protein